ncbi:hypothetical protein LXL04_010136 [Taraxacum kok-saghyz]
MSNIGEVLGLPEVAGRSPGGIQRSAGCRRRKVAGRKKVGRKEKDWSEDRGKRFPTTDDEPDVGGRSRRRFLVGRKTPELTSDHRRKSPG